ncbi:hypothetical protein VTH06DRAFT_1484 [Thermothelomyces fergusii]
MNTAATASATGTSRRWYSTPFRLSRPGMSRDPFDETTAMTRNGSAQARHTRGMVVNAAKEAVELFQLFHSERPLVPPGAAGPDVTIRIRHGGRRLHCCDRRFLEAFLISGVCVSQGKN